MFNKRRVMTAYKHLFVMGINCFSTSSILYVCEVIFLQQILSPVIIRPQSAYPNDRIIWRSGSPLAGSTGI